jgi:ribosomal protein L30E
MTDAAEEIKQLQAEKRLVLGTEQTEKLVRQGKLAKVYLSSNCPPAVKADLTKFCKLSGIECQELAATNEELGVWCRKQYAVSVIGVLKSAA